MNSLQVFAIVLLTAFAGRANANADLSGVCATLAASADPSVIAIDCTIAAPFFANRLHSAGIGMGNIGNFLTTGGLADDFCDKAEAFIATGAFADAITLTDCGKLTAAITGAAANGGPVISALGQALERNMDLVPACTTIDFSVIGLSVDCGAVAPALSQGLHDVGVGLESAVSTIDGMDWTLTCAPFNTLKGITGIEIVDCNTVTSFAKTNIQAGLLNTAIALERNDMRQFGEVVGPIVFYGAMCAVLAG